MVLTLGHGLLITRLNMQPFIVTLCGLLFYRGLARFITNDETKGFGTVAGLDFLRYLANGNLVRHTDAVCAAADHQLDYVGGAASLSLRSLPFRHRPQRGSSTLRGHQHQTDHHPDLRDRRRAHRHLGNYLRLLYKLSFTGESRQCLRALRHRRGGAGRLFVARR